MTYFFFYFVGELLFDLRLLKGRTCQCNFTFLNSPSCRSGVKNLLGVSQGWNTVSLQYRLYTSLWYVQHCLI